MSLYSDLTEVLTPYANKIKELNGSLEDFLGAEETLVSDKINTSTSTTPYNYFYEVHTAENDEYLTKAVVRGRSGTTPVLAVVRKDGASYVVREKVTLNENTGSDVTTNIKVLLQAGDIVLIGGGSGSAYYTNTSTPISRISQATLNVGDTVTLSNSTGDFSIALYKTDTDIDSLKTNVDTLGDSVNALSSGLGFVEYAYVKNDINDSTRSTSYDYFYEVYIADKDRDITKAVVRGANGNTPSLALVRNVDGTYVVRQVVTLNTNTGADVETKVSIQMKKGDILFIGGIRGFAYYTSTQASIMRINKDSLEMGEEVTVSSSTGTLSVALYETKSKLDTVGNFEKGYDENRLRKYVMTGTRVTENGLVISMDYPETHSDNFGLSLDSIAWENKTYRDIFVTENVMHDYDFENGLPSGCGVNKGEVTVTIEEHAGGSKSIFCKATGNNANLYIYDDAYIPQSKRGVPAYFAYSANVVSYTSGQVGIRDIASTQCNHITDGWETVVAKDDTGNFDFCGKFFGLHTTDPAEAYFDELVLFSGDGFETYPTAEEFAALYETYLSIINDGQPATHAEIMVKTAEVEEEHTNLECLHEFIRMMNVKAAKIGMANTNFGTASGLDTRGVSTARDLCRLGIEACGYSELLRIWNKRTATMRSRDGKVVTTSTSVHNDDIEADYWIVGGKTGTVYQYQNLVLVTEVDGEWIATAVMDDTGSYQRWIDTKKILDARGGTPETLTVTAACAAKVPRDPWTYEGYSFDWLYEKNADQQILPASTTKLMAAITALDWIDNVNEFLTCTVESGLWAAGDVITYEDCLLSMMLPSDNGSADNIAYAIGRKMLNHKTNIVHYTGN